MKKGQTKNNDFEMKCLDPCFITFDDLYKNIDTTNTKKPDKRAPVELLHKFITRNRKVFEFLDITANIDQEPGKLGVTLQSGHYVGCIPLFSPQTGKIYGSLYVKPRFGESAEELITLLQDTITPEFLDLELPLRNAIPYPIYYDCIEFLKIFRKAIDEVWTKFETINKNENVPRASTNWKRYVEHCYDPKRQLIFNNRKSIQSRDHREWQQLTFVAKFALDTLSSPSAPLGIKIKGKRLLDTIRHYISSHKTEANQALFAIRSFEPPIIRQLKAAANQLINRKQRNRFAWRMDCAELFERYTQFVFKRVASIIGARFEANPKFTIGHQRPSWCLKYLEPDIMLVANGRIIVADVKYKTHMFNINSGEANLKEPFRHDLHQILAYSTFDTSSEKTALLIYPSVTKDGLISRLIDIHGAQARVNVYLIGISLNTTMLNNICAKLADILRTELQNR